MLSSPWDVLLTVVFAFTGVGCVGYLIAHWSHDRREALVDVNHALMSVGMIAMIWLPTWDTTVWVRLALFTVLAVGILVAAVRARGDSRRVDLTGHFMLGIAMIWMIAAMPLLMAGATEGTHGEHGEAAAGAMWVDVVNNVFVALCIVWFAWWVFRAATYRGYRLHSVGHAAMAVGMAVMLLLMNV